MFSGISANDMLFEASFLPLAAVLKVTDTINSHFMTEEYSSVFTPPNSPILDRIGLLVKSGPLYVDLSVLGTGWPASID